MAVRIPEIPATVSLDRDVERIFSPIKETLDIWAGRVGDPDQDKLISRAELDEILVSDSTIQSILRSIPGLDPSEFLKVNGSNSMTGTLFTGGNDIRIDAGEMRGNNDNFFLVGRNFADSANINMFKVNTSDKIEAGTDLSMAGNLLLLDADGDTYIDAKTDDIIQFRFPTDTTKYRFTSTGLILESVALLGNPNNVVFIKGRNQANTAFVDMIKLNASDDIEFAADLQMPHDLVYSSTGGVPFGEIYAHDNSTTTSVSSSGWTQITIFDTNGVSNLTTPDNTTDDITVSKAGKYLVTVSIAIENSAGVAHVVEFSVFKNNGATEFTNVHSHRSLPTSTDIGAMSLSGIVDLNANDTVELWASSDSATARTITVSDVTLSLIQVGG